MSHFKVLVITKEQPTQELLEKIMLPWHEFGCTGLDNEYVVDKDVLEENKKEWENYKEDYPKFRDFLSQWYGMTAVEHGEEVDRSGPHKYGHFKVDENDEVIECIDRCTPNQKWDWWVVGGRYGGTMRAIDPMNEHVDAGKESWGGPNSDQKVGGLDICRRGNLDLDAMKKFRVDQNQKHWEELLGKIMEKHELTEEQVRGYWKTFADNVDAETEAWNNAENKGRRWDYWKERSKGAFREAIDSGVPGMMQSMFDGLGIDENQADIDAWVNDVPALTAYAFVTVEGEWVQKGEMGWWGMDSSDISQAEWNRRVDEYVKALPEDHWIASLDCHT